MAQRDWRSGLRRRCYEILEQGPVGDHTSMLVDRLLVLLILVNLVPIARYSPAMRSLLAVIYRERRALVGCVVILLGTTFIAASLMHLAEARAQPGKFGTIPDAMWWAIVTLGTIGYGDVVPITVVGKL